MACNQVLYHLQERAIEHAVIPWCEAHGVAVVAYSPFGQDSFPGPRTAGGRVLPRLRRPMAQRRDRSRSRFLLRYPNMFVIPKAASVAHVEENAAAGDLALAREEIARIEAAFPLGRKLGSLPML